MVTTKTANLLKPSETTCNHPNSAGNHPKLSKTTQKPTKTIRNGLKLLETNPKFPKSVRNSPTPLKPPVTHRATSRQFLPCFSVVEFEHELIVRRAKLGKNDENPSNDHESETVDPFSQLWKITLK